MNEDFVPYEVAVKLKEKGYPQRCCGEYNMIGACYINDGRFNEDGCIAPVEKCFTAPRIDQVLKWLREKKLHVSIMTFMFKAGWCYEVVRLGESPKLVAAHRNYYTTYEKAAIAGIEYTLYNLI